MQLDFRCLKSYLYTSIRSICHIHLSLTILCPLIKDLLFISVWHVAEARTLQQEKDEIRMLYAPSVRSLHLDLSPSSHWLGPSISKGGVWQGDLRTDLLVAHAQKQLLEHTALVSDCHISAVLRCSPQEFVGCCHLWSYSKPYLGRAPLDLTKLSFKLDLLTTSEDISVSVQGSSISQAVLVLDI